MKAPNFWKKRNLLAYLLLPASYLFELAGFLRNLTIRPRRVKKPVICIGNLTVGGTGKTPIALKIGKILQELKIDFAYLGHGYGSENQDLIIVDKNSQSSKVGDEALLLSEISQTFVAKNRVFAAQQIAKLPKKKLIIMDDGLQNPSLIKDFSILIIDGNYGFGNEFILPAGPLRQRIKAGLKNIDLIFIIGEDKLNLAKKLPNKKIISAQIKVINTAKKNAKPVIAFCGIGRPDKFFASLKKANYKVIQEISFADHYFYQEKDIDILLDLARKSKANLITTKKDWIKFSKENQKKIEYLDIEIELQNEDEKYLKNKLKELAGKKK